MPSSRILAPSLISAYMQRSTISSSPIERRAIPSRAALGRDDVLDGRIGQGRAAAFLVAIPAGAGLLAEAAPLAELVDDLRDAARRRAASPPAACGCASSRRCRPCRSSRSSPIGRPNSSRTLSTCCGQRAFLDQELGLREIRRRPCGCRRSRRTRRPAPGTLPIVRPSFIVVAITSLALALPRTTSSRRMTFAGLKKCMPMTSARPPRGGGDLVDVERRSVGGEDGARLAQPVEFAEHLLLDVHVLEHRLDDDVRFAHARAVERPLDQLHALVLAACGSRPLATVAA